MKVHGYTDEFLSDKKFIDIVDEFLEFIKDKKIVIHNAEFDISHLNNELSLINRDLITKNYVIDTLEIARNKFPGSGISLDALCKRFRVDNSRREKHNAILDCELLAKVYINLLDQKEPIFEFRAEAEKKNNRNNGEINYSKKIIKISEKEFESHKKFLKTELKKTTINLIFVGISLQN